MVSIVFAGVGGQGVVTVANIVGRAAVAENKNVLMTELHGMAQRGGRISVEIRIGNYHSAIIPDYTADALVGFEELETLHNISKLKSDGLILLNRRRIHPVTLTMMLRGYPEEEIERELKKHSVVTIEADKTALELGNKRAANTIMVGALFATGLLGLREESITGAIKRSLSQRHWDVNLQAFSEGKKLSLLEAPGIS